MELPQELLQDIFVHLGFASQCRFQRICRRWSRILHTNLVRRNLIVHLPIHTNLALSCAQRNRLPDSFQKASSQVHNVAIIGNSTHNYVHDVGWILDLVEQMARPLGRLLIQNLGIQNPGSLGFANCDADAGFCTVELRNVTFVWVAIFAYASTAAEDYPGGRFWRVQAVLEEGLDIDFTVAGPYVLYDGPLDKTQKRAAFRKMVAENLPPLPVAEMRMLRYWLETLEEAVVREMILELLRLYHPDMQLLPGQNLTELDYASFSSLVCRLLFAWDGTALGDDDENADDDYDDEFHLV